MKLRHLEITTMIGCRVACVYCPQDKISHRYQGVDRMMNLDDFKAYIDKVPNASWCIYRFRRAVLNPGAWT